MLPRRRFAKDAPPPNEIVYFSYEESLAKRRAARPKARYVLAALLGSALVFCAALYMSDRFGFTSYYATRLAGVVASAIGAMFIAPTFAALSGRNYVVTKRGDRP